ncbi:MAG TPA: TetR/AcrR family transcriptional regulator [Baekduia sp.]|nr:TetR/AcrR family transcriptional regulator [Baekduia sp.]
MGGTETQRPSVRDAALQATRERILDAAADAWRRQWYDDVTLRAIARDAGVALQTVVNHFGTKEALFLATAERIGEGIAARRWVVAAGDVEHALEVLVADYEDNGDATVRNLAVEEKVPEVGPMIDLGRRGHEAWCEHCFAGALDGLRGAERRRRLAQLVAVTDVYTWKILRRDKGLSQAQVRTAMRELVLALHQTTDTEGEAP